MKIQHDYKNYYNDTDFWSKIKSIIPNANRKLIETAITLYYIARSTDTPVLIKVSIFAVLGYLIMPMDLIPDVLPFGFSDDIAAMLTALKANQSCITEEIKQNVIHTMKRFNK